MTQQRTEVRPLLFGTFKCTSPPVFASSAVVAFGLIAFVLRDPAHAAAAYATCQYEVTARFGWLDHDSIMAVLEFSLPGARFKVALPVRVGLWQVLALDACHAHGRPARRGGGGGSAG